jgi:DNA-binding GntR family transcriptional regulator
VLRDAGEPEGLTVPARGRKGQRDGADGSAAIALPVRKEPDLPSQIAAGIREMINDGVLIPGGPLLQLELAVRFGVSRAPVREALKLLMAEAAVEHDPNRGFQVARLSSVEARQLYRIRRLLESELLRTVCWPTPSQLTVLRATLGSLDAGLAASARADWLIAHSQFHTLVFGLSPERAIAREVLRLIRQTDRYRALAPRASWGSEFPATPEYHLVDALAAHDRDALLAAYDRDRDQVEQHLIASLEARGL